MLLLRIKSAPDFVRRTNPAPKRDLATMTAHLSAQWVAGWLTPGHKGAFSAILVTL